MQVLNMATGAHGYDTVLGVYAVAGDNANQSAGYQRLCC